MILSELTDQLDRVDFAIRECNGGWVVIATTKPIFKCEANSHYVCTHVFLSEEEVTEWLLGKMKWLKASRNVAEFDDNSDDYPGGLNDAPTPVPTIKGGKPSP